MSYYDTDSRDKVTICLPATNMLFLFCVMQLIFNMFIFFGMTILFWKFLLSLKFLNAGCFWTSPTLIPLFQLLVQSMSIKPLWLRNFSPQR